MSPARPHRIAVRLALWLLLVALVPLALLTVSTTFLAGAAMRADVYAHLGGIADAKVQQFEQFFDERHSDALMVAALAEVREALSGRGDPARLSRTLADFSRQQGYRSLIVADANHHAFVGRLTAHAVLRLRKDRKRSLPRPARVASGQMAAVGGDRRTPRIAGGHIPQGAGQQRIERTAWPPARPSSPRRIRAFQCARISPIDLHRDVAARLDIGLPFLWYAHAERTKKKGRRSAPSQLTKQTAPD